MASVGCRKNYYLYMVHFIPFLGIKVICLSRWKAEIFSNCLISNVCFKKTWTNCSTVSLLWVVQVFFKQMLGKGGFKSEGIEEFSKAFFNPEITEFSEKQEYMVEGCLSFPGLFVKVKRPTEITFTYEDEDGTKFYDHLSGITARIVQHEIDHLNGMFLIREDLRDMDKKIKEYAILLGEGGVVDLRNIIIQEAI